MLMTVDIEAKIGRALTASEIARIQTDIEDAYAIAEAHNLVSIPETAAQRAVMRRVIVRAFRNPEGVQQETSGSYSVSYRNDTAPGVYFTASDIADLRGLRSGVYSVRLTTPAER